MKTLKWGLIGCGDIARKRVAPALRDLEHCQLHAVNRADAGKAAAFANEFGAAKWYEHWQELVQDPEVEAVYIATPVYLHAEQTVAAARAGKHVLCEKPMALNLDECDRMLQACDERNVRLSVAYYRHFYPVLRRIKQMLQLLPTQEPVLVHNVDVVSDLDLNRLLAAHKNRNAEATLAVMNRPTKRYLVFDHNNALIDREKTGQTLSPAAQRLAFNGIQVVHPGLFANAPSGPFSCIEYYIELARHHHPVYGFDMTGSYWRDLGRLSDLQQAEEDIENGRLAL